MSPTEIAVLSACAAVAGGVNALAGGGMLVAYPVLVAFGLSPIAANATATVALLSAGIGAQVGYRSEMKGTGRYAVGLIGPCLVGGAIGAFLLLRTPPANFAAMVPGFVLLATALFAAQSTITRFARHVHARLGGSPGSLSQAAQASDGSPGSPVPLLLMTQFAISIYIGYFGAGAGALMLASFGFFGLTNIHQMNGMKLWCGMLTNITAAVIFAVQPSLVHWPMIFVMIGGSTAGGYLTSRIAQRIPDRVVRLVIIAIGVAMAAWLVVGLLRAK
jgi:uncharacterized protein